VTERRIERHEPIAVVRLPDLSDAAALSSALVAGGIRVLEFTLTNREALAAIEEVRPLLAEEVLVGAGTVLDAESAGAAILAGAQFLVTPTLQPDVVSCGLHHGVPVICGAFTPTEILQAAQSGAQLVKVFPAGSVGPGYIKDVLGPLPHVDLVPTGGITLDNCRQFLDAGAYTVAVGGKLVDGPLVERRDWDAICARALRFVEACAAYRPSKSDPAPSGRTETPASTLSTAPVTWEDSSESR
jgi:2-dehydro-3-deoxyphosphogluconate aldolase/(4S)-4-hydroxy-2-oxoglutarate aldolase